jgi:hypothetical protein
MCRCSLSASLLPRSDRLDLDKIDGDGGRCFPRLPAGMKDTAGSNQPRQDKTPKGSKAAGVRDAEKACPTCPKPAK